MASSVQRVTAEVGDRTISFETTEAIDDINVEMRNGARIYIQAKATISYSTTKDSQLRAVLKQFELQSRAAPGATDRTGRRGRRVRHLAPAGPGQEPRRPCS